ncbi:helix-turn-helix domain-containing protein [Saccharothrix sp. S26]|uniref:NACHT domain-containing protein n=1 Tax=Saccharothrix sp. S26 TaxID=2907215 RepID=UPI001F40FEB7|nr:helix-turn-helix transcriptional regulator [Saccharothrix sp. S26]MCE6997286.1 helix-turn-helix domain-containing protein [Saccharothrix sp. S26]
MADRFGVLLRRFRREAGLTQDELAVRSGVAVRTVRRFETQAGVNPQLSTVRQLAEALALSPAEHATLLAAVGQADEPAPSDRPVAPADAARVQPGRYLTANERELVEAADELADVVRARWQQEEMRRRIHDPGPLPLRWRSVGAELTDPDAPTDLAGTLDAIVPCYRRVPSGRLVVLGRAGAGKSMLAVRLVLDLLNPSTAAGAVPVVVGIGSWHPVQTSFHEWLVAELTRHYPGLARPSRSGATLAARLIESGRILPVLDGFDEIAEGLHRPALVALNQIVLPLVLTSRPDEYRDAVTASRVLRGAAAVELADLTVADLADHLPRTARRTAGDLATAWDPVLRELAERPDLPPAVALTTPLMVGLARANYSDTTGRDPAELLDARRFPTAESIADHLLAGFVPTAYRHQPLDRAVGLDQRWSVEEATRWLRFLAAHLDGRRTTDLAWWEFGTAFGRGSRTSLLGLVAGVTTAVVDWLVEGVASAFGVTIGSSSWFLSGLLIGFLGAVLMVVTYAVTVGRGVPAPLYLRISVRGGRRRLSAQTRSRLRTGALCGFVFGVLLGTAHRLLAVVTSRSAAAVGSWVFDAVAFGLVYAVGVGLVFRVLGLIETPVDLTSAGRPADLIRANRAVPAGPALVLAPLFAGFIVAAAEVLDALDVGRPFGIDLDWAPSLVVAAALVSAVAGAAGYVLGMTPWGHWLVFARIWLPLTGRLPWAVVAFLEDACRRGVLRQSGPYYQFRHARLQAHLAAARQPVSDPA